jgi:toluene monooxygenase system protein E
LVLKPLVDELFMKCLSDLALVQDDYLLGQIFYSLNEDCRWHRQWTESLVQMVIQDNILNRDIIQAWINRWYPLAARAVHTITTFLEATLVTGKTPLPISESLAGFYRGYLQSMNLEAG